jgi:short chain dehydrogenase-like protein
MVQAVLRVAGLPDAPLDAAAAFHAEHLPQARALLADADTLVLVFQPAGHAHRAWRLAAVQELAREAAPKRVNGIAGADEAAVGETLAFLEAAPGVTGQLLAAG